MINKRFFVFIFSSIIILSFQFCDNTVKSDAEEPFMVIRDFDYVKEAYFWVSSDYKDQIYPISDNMMLIPNVPPLEDMQLYKSVSSKEEPGAFQATVWLDATDTAAVNDQTVRDKYFIKLKSDVDYEKDNSLGFFKLNIDLAEDEILAVTFKNSMEAIGDFNQKESPQNLQLIPGDLALKNVYNLGLKHLNSDRLNIKIRNNITERYKAENGVSWNTIFGLDRYDDDGNPGADGDLDKMNAFVFHLNQGEIWLPFHKPFVSRSWAQQQGKTTKDGEYNDLLPEEYSVNVYKDDYNWGKIGSNFVIEVYY